MNNQFEKGAEILGDSIKSGADFELAIVQILDNPDITGTEQEDQMNSLIAKNPIAYKEWLRPYPMTRVN